MVIDEVSNALLDFSSQQFVESASSKLIDKSFYLFLILRQSKSEVDVDVHPSVIFGWTFVHRCVVVYDILGNHACHSPPFGVAEMSTWLH